MRMEKLFFPDPVCKCARAPRKGFDRGTLLMLWESSMLIDLHGLEVVSL